MGHGTSGETRMQRIVLAAALACVVTAMAAGIWNVIGLFDDANRQAVLQALTDQQILEPKAMRAWLGIHRGVTVFCTALSWMVGIPLVLSEVLRRRDLGLAMLAPALTALRQGLRIFRIVLICVFVFKFTRYALWCTGINGGSFLFFGMALFEGFLFTLVMLAFFWGLRFLEAAADSVCTIRYVELSGESDARGIIPGTVAGLFVLSAVHVLLAMLYRWSSPLSAAQLAMAAADLLLGVWVRRYKSAMEWQQLRQKEA